jgi:hypothetical protein
VFSPTEAAAEPAAPGIAPRTAARSQRPVEAELPTAPRSSMKVHSAAIRLTTSSAVNIAAIATTFETQPVRS